LKQSTAEDVAVAESHRRAALLLQTESYSAVVFDQHQLEAEPDEGAATMQHLDAAIPLQIDFAISGVERVVREVRAALCRRSREQIARQAVVGLLQSELSGIVTALLLQCELALETPSLPDDAVEKLRSAYYLVQKLRSQLENNSTQP
jgi:hypothetical protein